MLARFSKQLDPLFTWKSRKMKDYRQHLPMNCGGVATVFALYGLQKVVPENVINEILILQSVAAKQIEKLINRLGKSNITAKAFLLGSTIPTQGDPKRPISFLHDLSPDLVSEGLKDIIVTNKGTRCLIISGYTDYGIHWQTCYIPNNNRIMWYNSHHPWKPAVHNTPVGTPAGMILVSGPAIN